MTGEPTKEPGKRGEDWADLLRRIELDLPRLHAGRGADEAPWEEVLHALRRIAYRVGSIEGQTDTEDIVQEVLLKLQSRDTIRRIRAAGSIRGYLAVILRNAARSSHRRERRGKRRLFEYFQEESRHASYGPPEEENRAARHLPKVLEGLGPSERELLDLRYWRELTLEDVAGRLGISYSAAAVRLHRLHRKLRAKLEEH